MLVRFPGLILVILALSCFSCSSDKSTNPSQQSTNIVEVFCLSKPGADEPGASLSIPLTGSDTAGGSYTGNYSTSILNRTPPSSGTMSRSLLTLRNESSGALINSLSETYYTGNGNPEFRDVDGLRYYCTDTQPAPDMPDSARIGDFGDLPTWEFSNYSGWTRITAAWRLDRKSNTQAYLVIASTVASFLGGTEAVEEMKLTINADGSLAHFRDYTWFPSVGVGLTLTGTPVQNAPLMALPLSPFSDVVY